MIAVKDGVCQFVTLCEGGGKTFSGGAHSPQLPWLRACRIYGLGGTDARRKRTDILNETDEQMRHERIINRTPTL